MGGFAADCCAAQACPQERPNRLDEKTDLALLMHHVGIVGSTQYSAAPEAAKQAAGLAGEPADRRQHRHIEALRDAALAVS